MIKLGLYVEKKKPVKIVCETIRNVMVIIKTNDRLAFKNYITSSLWAVHGHEKKHLTESCFDNRDIFFNIYFKKLVICLFSFSIFFFQLIYLNSSCKWNHTSFISKLWNHTNLVSSLSSRRFRSLYKCNSAKPNWTLWLLNIH